MSARVEDVIAAELHGVTKGETARLTTTRILAALHAAGFVVVPKEPTGRMWAAAGDRLVNGRIKIKAHHDYLSETVWTAMLAAAPPLPPRE